MIVKVSHLLCLLLSLLSISLVLSKKEKEPKKPDPRECEVCIANLEAVDQTLSSEQRKDKLAVREAIGKRCTKSGFGSEWVPNPNLSQKDIKMCYIFEPIKDSIVTPFITGMPKEKICKRLKKDNPDICDVKYPLKVEKKEGEKVDYTKMKVKELKEILNQRNVKCSGCTEKADYVKKCEETEHMEM